LLPDKSDKNLQTDAKSLKEIKKVVIVSLGTTDKKFQTKRHLLSLARDEPHHAMVHALLWICSRNKKKLLQQK